MEKWFLSTKLVCIIVCFIYSFQAFAQPEPCSIPETMTPFCADACIICDIDGFTGSNNLTPVGEAPPGFCTITVHNAGWIAFIAGSVDIEIEFFVNNCLDNFGLELGIYQSLDCQSFQQVSNCLGAGTAIGDGETGVFNNTVPLVIGQYYYVVVDGGLGDVCDWTFTVTEGTTEVPPLNNSGVISGDFMTCPDYNSMYSTTGEEGAVQYTWTADGSYIGEGQDFTYDWPADGVYELCVTASNACDEAPPVCEMVTVVSIPDTEIFVEICQSESYEVAPGIIISSIGVYDFTFEAVNGCDSIVIVTLEFFQEYVINVEVDNCEADELIIDGQEITEDGIYSELFQTVDFCDSLVIYNVDIITHDTIEVLLTTCDASAVDTTSQLTFDSNGCPSTILTIIALLESDTTTIISTTCDPDQAGESIDTLMNIIGCDSLIITNIELLPSDTTLLEMSTCDPDLAGISEVLLTNLDGCDSLVITDYTLNESDSTLINVTSCDMSAVGVLEDLLINEDGCDSLIITTVIFSASDTTCIESFSCDPDDVMISEELLINSIGCDSLVINKVLLLDSDSTYIITESCDPDLEGETIDILTNSDGCDSTIFTTTILLLSDTTQLVFSTCEESDAGVFENFLFNTNGCDSLVVSTFNYIQEDTTYIDNSSCIIDEVGQVELLLANSFGCDSLIITTTIFSESDTTYIFEQSCDENMVGIFEDLLTNSKGCDSLVILEVDQIILDTTFLEQLTCDPNLLGDEIQELISSDGCDSIILTATSLLPIADCDIIIAYVGDDISCTESFGSITLNVQAGEPPFNFTWSGDNGDSGMGQILNLNEDVVIDQLASGNYTVIMTDSFGYSNSIAQQIEQSSPLDVSVEITSVFNDWDINCAGGNDGSAQVTVLSQGATPFSYTWSNGQDLEEATNLSSGEIFVTVTDAEGCFGKDSIILVDPPVVLIDIGLSPISCFGDDDGIIEVSVIEGGVAPFLYAVSDGLYDEENTFSGLAPGIYDVFVADANNCVSMETVIISNPDQFVVDLPSDTTVNLGESLILNATTNIDPSILDLIVWENENCVNCTSLSISPISTTSYSVSVISTEGCIATDDVTVSVKIDKDLDIPNIFSPNGDGINDVFRIKGNNNVVSNIVSLRVFSRWGEQIYAANNFSPDDESIFWDGNYKGNQLNPGVYVFQVELEYVDGEKVTLTGDVTIVR